jgi:hypothetical protein
MYCVVQTLSTKPARKGDLFTIEYFVEAFYMTENSGKHLLANICSTWGYLVHGQEKGEHGKHGRKMKIPLVCTKINLC